MRPEVLEEADPPVVVAWNEEGLEWTTSHAHLSGFLDDTTYLHAFSGGAIHGSWTDLYSPALPVHHIAWLEEQWSKATVTPLAFGFDADPAPTLYVRDGQAFWAFGACSLAAREAEALDEIAQRFQIKWAHRWRTRTKSMFHVKHAHNNIIQISNRAAVFHVKHI